MRYLMIAGAVLGISLVYGCGGEEYRYAVENPDPPEVVYANEVYTRLQEMKEVNRREGPMGVDTIGFLEGMEGYGEEPPVGEHGPVYDAIIAGVKEIQQMAQSGGSRDAVGKKIDELLSKAETLPHKIGAAPAAE